MKEPAAQPARLIAVSTASMGPADNLMGPGPRLLFRFFRTIAVPNLGRVGKDLQAMENELAASGLDWHALRPVKLTDGPQTGHVQAGDRFTMKTISRADVAWQILALAEDPARGRSRTPVITTGPSSKSRPAPSGPVRPRPATSPPGRRPRLGRHHEAASARTRQPTPELPGNAGRGRGTVRGGLGSARAEQPQHALVHGLGCLLDGHPACLDLVLGGPAQCQARGQQPVRRN
jgi:hypothetical protein